MTTAIAWHEPPAHPNCKAMYHNWQDENCTCAWLWEQENLDGVEDFTLVDEFLNEVANSYLQDFLNGCNDVDL